MNDCPVSGALEQPLNVAKVGGSGRAAIGIDAAMAAVALAARRCHNMAMRIEPAEYERMRSWFAYMVPKVFPSDLLTPETDPVAVLDRMASKSPAKARNSRAMAIGDVVDYTSDWISVDVTKCNGELSQMGLPTLTDVQTTFSKLVQRVVRRGRIKNDEEFYALRNAAEQRGAGAPALWRILEAYEAPGATG